MIHRILLYALYALLLLAINYGLFHLKAIEFKPILLAIYAFVATMAILFEMILWKIEDPKRFIVSYMGFSGGKMFLSLFFLLICIFTDRPYMIPFAVSFLFAYFAFTILEITRLLRFFKK